MNTTSLFVVFLIVRLASGLVLSNVPNTSPFTNPTLAIHRVVSAPHLAGATTTVLEEAVAPVTGTSAAALAAVTTSSFVVPANTFNVTHSRSALEDPPDPDLIGAQQATGAAATPLKNFPNDEHVGSVAHNPNATIAAANMDVTATPDLKDDTLTVKTVISIVGGSIIFISAYLAFYFFLYPNACCGRKREGQAPPPVARTVAGPTPVPRMWRQWTILVFDTARLPQRSASRTSFGTHTATTLVSENELVVRTRDGPKPPKDEDEPATRADVPV